ncbi:MAG: TonB-dependent receptor plug domain-containing protein [Flavobacteriales bacterium]
MNQQINYFSKKSWKTHFFLTVILLLLSVSNTQAQNQLTLKIYDAYTYQPIIGVQVKSEFGIDKTDQNGELAFKKIPGQLVLSHPDYLVKVLPLSQISERAQLHIDVILEPNSQTEEELVVSANRNAEKRKDVAQKIQVLRAAEMQFQQQTSMADVLQNSGSVFVQKSQLGGGSPIIRGFETNKVLLVVDGIRMNNAIYRGGHLQNVITLDQANVDRVELVFGPGSVMYGSDAIGGVMSFQTKKPVLSSSDALLVKASAYTRYFSAANGYAANAQVNVANKRFGSLTSFSYASYGDLRQGAKRSAAIGSLGVRNWYVDRINGVDSMMVNLDSNLQIGSGYNQYDVLQKFTFVQKEGVTHQLNLQLSNSGNIDRYDRLTLMSGSKPKFAEWYYGPQFRLLTAYTLELTNATKYYDQARIILAYQGIEESRIDRRFKKDTRNHRIEKLNIYTLNVDLLKKIGKNELRYGLDAYINQVNSTAYAENILTGEQAALDTRYPDGGSSMNGAALYFSHTYELSDKLILNDGLRLSQIGLNAQFVDQTFFPFPFNSITQNHTALNGNLGLIYMPTKQLRMTLNGSTAFRAPNVDDLTKVFESVPGNVIVPNPNLKNEYAYNSEFGLSYRMADRVTVGANAYATLLRNALTVQNGTFNGADNILYDGQLSQVMTTTNAAKARVWGVELFLNAKIANNLALQATYNYTNGRILTDTVPYPLDHIAPAFGKASLIYTKMKWRAEFFAQYSGWKKLEDYNLIGEDNYSYATPEGMPSWYTLNLRMNYAFSKNLSVQAACENILDQNYRLFASNISAPGRNFILTLRGNF